MLKRFIKRVQVNFRQTNSDRSATSSYRNYHQKLRKIFQDANLFNKLKRDKKI
jgi:hypothetical protein